MNRANGLAYGPSGPPELRNVTQVSRSGLEAFAPPALWHNSPDDNLDTCADTVASEKFQADQALTRRCATAMSASGGISPAGNFLMSNVRSDFGFSTEIERSADG